MSSEKIVTLFDTLEHARAAESNLLKAGFHQDDISIIESRHLRDYEDHNKDVSIWKRLFGNDVDDEYAAIYSDAVRTNGAVLSMKVKNENEQATALAILNRHQIVDVGARRASSGDAALPLTDRHTTQVPGEQRRDALKPDEQTRATLPAGEQNHTHLPSGEPGHGILPTGDRTMPGEKSSLAPPVTAKTDTPWLTGNETKDEILRLAREELEVGKRLVKEGTTRIRRYVTEENVSRTVNLREQHAEILRQAVNRPVTEKDVDWSDKEIVIDELAEKPVVSKSVHITEEVAVKKTNTDREEKISDTIRQQHVDVERSGTDERKDDLPKK